MVSTMEDSAIIMTMIVMVMTMMKPAMLMMQILWRREMKRKVFLASGRKRKELRRKTSNYLFVIQKQNKTGYKINIQKSLAFLHTNNKRS